MIAWIGLSTPVTFWEGQAGDSCQKLPVTSLYLLALRGFAPYIENGTVTVISSISSK